jgi:hypothetical protein
MDCPLLAELEELSCQLDAAPSPESAGWLSGPMLHAVGALLHAALHRTFGRLAPAAASLAKAEEAIGQQLRLHGIDVCAVRLPHGSQHLLRLCGTKADHPSHAL